MNEFNVYGRRLIANGYLIIPIRPGEKRPALQTWQNARITAADLSQWPTCGVGILTGQGSAPVVGIDLDIGLPDVVEDLVKWCHANIGYTPPRVGKPPKALLVYRGPSGMKKWTAPWYHDAIGGKHRVEILADGQQFVAYHIHPDTGRPYTWDHLVGDGLVDINVRDLPEFDERHLAAFGEYVHQVLIERGLTTQGVARKTSNAARQHGIEDDDPMMISRPLELSLEEARDYIQYLDHEDYDTWLHVGMALHHEFRGSTEGCELWNEWSAGARNYAGGDDLANRWEGFQVSSRSRTMRWVIKVANKAKEEQESTQRVSTREAVMAAVRDAGSIEDIRRIAPELAERTRSDALLHAETVSRIHARLKDLDSPIPIAVVRNLLSGERKAAGGSREYSERGNAQRLVDAHGAGLMYVRELGQWYRWQGVRWVPSHDLDIEELAQSTLDALWDEVATLESDEEKQAFRKFALRSQTHHMVVAMRELAKSEAQLAVPVADLDKDPMLFGVGNGVAHLGTGRLLLPQPEQRVTTGTDIEYDISATCPLWERTVLEVFNDDQEYADFFHRLVGYIMMGQPNEDLLVIPYGNGANGKSTIFSTLQRIFGKYAKTAQAETFTASRPGMGALGGAPREDLLRLRGARLALVGEPEDDVYLRESLIKSVTGGDKIVARGIHAKSSSEFAPTWVPVMPTNHRPVIRGEDHGVWRRILAIPFTRNFDEDLTIEKDIRREEKLRAEDPGILMWCIRGARLYQKQGLKPPAIVESAKRQYRDAMDILKEWKETRCDVGGEFRDSSANLWASWEAFARSRGELKLIPSARSLGKRLANFCTSVTFRDPMTGDLARGWAGLRVKPQDSDGSAG